MDIINKFKNNQEFKYSVINLGLILIGIFGLIFLTLINNNQLPEDELIIPTSLELETCQANYNGDNIIDNYDLVLFIRHYRDQDIDCRYDLTGDCFLDTKDYSGFATQFGDTCN